MLLAVLLAVLLAGCTPPAADPPLFPLNPGWRWDYAVTTERPGDLRRETLTVENRAPVAFGERASAGHRVNSLGNHYFIRSDDTGVYRVGSRHESDTLVRLDDTEAARFVLKLPVAAGTAWQVPTHPYLSRRKLDTSTQELKYGRPVPMSFRIDATDEPVAVPAGRFEHCVRVSGEHTIHNLADHVVGYVDLVLAQREWYCPGVGLVRLEREEVAARSQLYQGGRYLLELTALHR